MAEIKLIEKYKENPCYARCGLDLKAIYWIESIIDKSVETFRKLGRGRKSIEVCPKECYDCNKCINDICEDETCCPFREWINV